MLSTLFQYSFSQQTSASPTEYYMSKAEEREGGEGGRQIR